MCFGKMPEPKAAPPPPDRNQATLAAIEEQRRSARRTGMSDNILTRLRDSDVAASATKKKLGE